MNQEPERAPTNPREIINGSRKEMRVPPVIRFGHKTYSVKLLPRMDVQGHLGSTNRYLRAITIQYDPNTPEETVDTLLHELIHVMAGDRFVADSLDMMHKADNWGYAEECIATVLGHALTEIFSRNPDLIRYLRDVYGDGVVA